MTPEAQNIALAEACETLACPGCAWKVMECADHDHKIPDYFADLNAQFKAWQKLTDDQKLKFCSIVGEIANREHIWYEEARCRFGCECLLRALGKWIE